MVGLLAPRCPPAEYAYVGYIAKRIGMRRTRLMAIQKMAIEKMQRDVRDHTAMLMTDEHTSKSAVSTAPTSG